MREPVECFARWTDQHGNVHETKRYTNLMVALRASWKDAERMGVERISADGIIVGSSDQQQGNCK